MKPSEAMKLVATLQGAFPAAAMTEATCRVYERFLLDLDPIVADAAIVRLISTCKFLPTIAEIRGMANDVARGPMRSAEEAWGDVVAAIRRFGSYRAPTFDDPLVAYAVKQLGWRNLCLEGSNDSADRARFCELYERAAARQKQDEVTGRALPARHATALPAPVTALVSGIGGGRA